MQPYEFYVCLEGSREKQKQEDIRNAYWMTWLLSPYSKKPLTVKQLTAPLWENPVSKAQKAKEDREILLREFGLENEKGK